MKKRIKHFLIAALAMLLCVTTTIPNLYQGIAAVATQELYISDVKLAYNKSNGQSGKKAALKELEDAGYTVVPYDLNSGTGKGWSYIGYKTTTNKEEAITDMKIMNMDGGWEESTYNSVTNAYSGTIKTLTEDLIVAINEFRVNYAKGSPAAKIAKISLNAITKDKAGTVKLGDYFLKPDSEANMEAFIKDFLLMAKSDVVSLIYAPLMLGTVEYDPNAKEVEDGEYAPYSFLAKVGDYKTPKDDKVKATHNDRYKKYKDIFADTTRADFKKAYQTAEEERTDEQKVLLAIKDTLNKYESPNSSYLLGDALLTENLTKKILIALIGSMTDGQFAMAKYCGLEVYVMAHANTEAAYQRALEAKKEGGNISLYAYEGADMTLYTEPVGLTAKASRDQASMDEFDLYQTLSDVEERKQTVEAAQTWIQNVSLISMGVMFVAKALGKATTWAAAKLATKVVAKAVLQKVIGGVISVIAKVAGYASGIGFLIDICIYVALFVVYLIQTYSDPEVDYSKEEKMPIQMYDTIEEKDGKKKYICYDLVTKPKFTKEYYNEMFAETFKFGYGEIEADAIEYFSDKLANADFRADLNCFQGSQWLALYTSKDTSLGGPILADTFQIKHGNSTTSDGYVPLTKFGESEAYNTNTYAYDDEYNGIYIFYKKVGGAYKTSTEGKYLDDIAFFAADSEEAIKEMIRKKSGEYKLYNYNIANHVAQECYVSKAPLLDKSKRFKYIYIAYKTTNSAENAITDIRVRPEIGVQYKDFGQVSYATATNYTAKSGENAKETEKTVLGVSLIYTRSSIAGDPLLAEFYFTSTFKDPNVPANYEPITHVGGGMPYNFNFMAMSDDDIKNMSFNSSNQIYIYCKSSEDYSNNPDYLSGIQFDLRSEGIGRSNVDIPTALSRICGNNFVRDGKTQFTSYLYEYSFTGGNYRDITGAISYSTTKNPKKAIKSIIACEGGSALPFALPVTSSEGTTLNYVASPVYRYYYDANDFGGGFFPDTSSSYGPTYALYVSIASDGDPILASDVRLSTNNKTPDGYVAVQTLFENSSTRLFGNTYLFYKGERAVNTNLPYISKIGVAGGNTKVYAKLGLAPQGVNTISQVLDDDYYDYDDEMPTLDGNPICFEYTSVGFAKTDNKNLAITGVQLVAMKPDAEPSDTKVIKGATFNLASVYPIIFMDHQGSGKDYPVYLYTSTNPACGSPITSFTVKNSYHINGTETCTVRNETGESKKFKWNSYFCVTRVNDDDKYVTDITSYCGWFKNNYQGDIQELMERDQIVYSHIDKFDLNSDAGGRYIQLLWKTGKYRSDAITDIVAYSKKNPPSSLTVNGCTYYLGCNGLDFNKGAGGKYIYLFYTRDPRAGDPIGDILVNESKYTSGYDGVKEIKKKSGVWKKQSTYDMNDDAGGDYVYIHMKRVPRYNQTNFIGSIFTDSTTGGIIAASSIIVLFAVAWVIFYTRKKKKAAVLEEK